MRTPQQHSRAAADLTTVSKQTNAPPQMSGVASIIKAAITNPLLPLVTVSYRSAAIYTVARVCSVAADAADSQGGNNQSVHVRSCPLPSVTVRFAAIYTTARVCGVAADAADSQGGKNKSVVTVSYRSAAIYTVARVCGVSDAGNVYLPMQKRENISSSRSGSTVSPTILPVSTRA